MYNIATLNKISKVGLANLSDKYTITDDVAAATGILVRSQDMHDMEFQKTLLAIARAGAGVNNIPLDRCADSGVVVFNTPGANANAVKELVLAGLLVAARNITEGSAWLSTVTDDVSKTVEKGKSQFAGTEIYGKTLGVIGLGAIGILVANAASDLGMKVIGYDPFLNVKAAHSLYPYVSVENDLKSVLGQCDYVTIHVPSSPSTNGMFNSELFDSMSPGTVLLNFSRDKLIDESALIHALENGKIKKYVTDFITEGIHGKSGVIGMPHLGASTEEAEDNCATMAVQELMDYIENGNITNSVNFPNISLGPIWGDNRVAIMTKGIDNPVNLALDMFKDIEIKGVVGDVKGDYGYALISTTTMLTSVPKFEGVVKVRVIQDL